MNGCVKTLFFILLAILPALAGDPGVVESKYAEKDVALDLNPASPFWKASSKSYMERDSFGKTVTSYRTEVRTRWTKNNLYFLFICPFDQLHLKPNPDTHKETNELWNWDVAEVFLGSDFTEIKRYKEFEVSPQGEWIDLDIDLHNPYHEEGWTWNSNFEVLAKVDQEKHIWYAAMKIPYSAVDTRPAAIGNTLRMNLFRSGGDKEHAYEVTWQPPMNKTFHTPERFGLLKLVK